MLNARPQRVRNLMLPGTVLLLGCMAQHLIASADQPVKPVPRVTTGLSVSMPVDALAANPRGRAVLQRDLPGLLTNSKYPLFSDMSLRQLASLSGGKLSQAKLAQVQADLAGPDVMVASQ